MTPILLSKKVPWFGEHTGYQQLPRYLQRLVPGVQVIMPRRRLGERVLGKAYSVYRGWSRRNQWDAAAEFRFASANGVLQPIRHILHLEEHVWYLDRWRKAPHDLVGTLHLPPDGWTEQELDYVSRLSSAIVLYRRDLPFFESLVGKGRVRFIPHGVDADFFLPAANPPEKRDLLFTGHYLRNARMLARVIKLLHERHGDLRFHLIVPEEFRKRAGFLELHNQAHVFWHNRLSDEELHQRIASSYLLVLPMNSSGANTAVVEALSCGTPVVTTDVGGIRDYGGQTIFPIVANDDDDAMVALVERYLGHREWRDEISLQCREFAVRELSWPLIARRHLETYEELGA